MLKNSVFKRKIFIICFVRQRFRSTPDLTSFTGLCALLLKTKYPSSPQKAKILPQWPLPLAPDPEFPLVFHMADRSWIANIRNSLSWCKTSQGGFLMICAELLSEEMCDVCEGELKTNVLLEHGWEERQAAALSAYRNL